MREETKYVYIVMEMRRTRNVYLFLGVSMSGFKHLQEELDCLVPFQGMCENPRTKNKCLEKYRQASNAAYDLFNNGLWNRKPLFKKIFGFAPNTRYATSVSWKQWEERVEEIFTPIMLCNKGTGNKIMSDNIEKLEKILDTLSNLSRC